QPVVGGDLSFAEGQTESPYGTIRSRWQRNGDRLTLEVTIPPNSQATIHLPTSDPATATAGRKPLAQAPGIEGVEQGKDHLVLRAGAGEYHFESHYAP
ncbi:MAG: alpha-L-rhamnosidase C-terminal domain-containing protein, partial [Opitutales bacterium]